jgi:hypothetical protein
MGDPIRSAGPCTHEALPDHLQLPYGVPHREHDPSQTQLRAAKAVGNEMVGLGLAVLARATGSRLLGVASSMAGPAGWLSKVHELAEELQRLPVDSDVQAFLRLACGDTGGGITSNHQDVVRTEAAAATAAVLLGLDEAGVERLRVQLAAGATFDRQLEIVRAMQRDKPTAFAEAAAQYGAMVAQWQAGVAAGIEGWDAPDRGSIFAAGREAAVAWLDSQPPEARRHTLQRARRAKHEAVVDVARQRVDDARAARDPHYRSGAHHARRLSEAEGVDTLAAAVAEAERWLAVNDPAARGAGPHCRAGRTPP